MREQTSSILTREEIDTLRRRLIDGATGTVTEAEVEALIGWAERMMEGYLALRVVLAGEARVAVEAGQVVIAPAWRVH
jgi:hypothetical protein